jgi:hypothetical protein
MAPEYAVLGHLSVKLDVYSFGVLVLEVVTGRRNTDTCFGSELEEPGTLLSYVSLPNLTIRTARRSIMDIAHQQNTCIVMILSPGMESLAERNTTGDDGSLV